MNHSYDPPNIGLHGDKIIIGMKTPPFQYYMYWLAKNKPYCMQMAIPVNVGSALKSSKLCGVLAILRAYIETSGEQTPHFTLVKVYPVDVLLTLKDVIFRWIFELANRLFT